MTIKVKYHRIAVVWSEKSMLTKQTIVSSYYEKSKIICYDATDTTFMTCPHNWEVAS